MTAARDVAKQIPPGSGIKEPTEDEIDLNLIGSFPASDPPSWTLGITREKDASTRDSDAPES
jgi:hypothetical protein